MPRRRVVAPRLDDYVEDLLTSFHSYAVVVSAAASEFGCDERTVERAIARVRERWKRLDAAEIAQRRAKFRAELHHAWRLALAAGDYLAVAVMARTVADIEGVRAPKHRPTGLGNHRPVRPVEAMSPQELTRELERLLAKRCAELGGDPAIAAIAIAAIPVATVDAIDVVPLPPDIRPARTRRRRRRSTRGH